MSRGSSQDVGPVSSVEARTQTGLLLLFSPHRAKTNRAGRLTGAGYDTLRRETAINN